MNVVLPAILIDAVYPHLQIDKGSCDGKSMTKRVGAKQECGAPPTSRKRCWILSGGMTATVGTKRSWDALPCGQALTTRSQGSGRRTRDSIRKVSKAAEPGTEIGEGCCSAAFEEVLAFRRPELILYDRTVQ
jgi:hypothetical protein